MTVKEITDAIDELFSDTTVLKQVTLERMQEIRDHVGISVDAIKEDMDAEDDGEEA